MMKNEDLSTRTKGRFAALIATLALVAFLSALHIFLEHRFFYWDDVQQTFAPVFYMIGEELRLGNWPAVTTLLWQGGFLVGEGLYQLFNPIALAIFFFLPYIDEIAFGMALHATIWLMIAASGVYLLALRLGSTPRWALIAGVAYAASPYLVYWLAASWINGAIAYAALPWLLFLLGGQGPSAAAAVGIAFTTFVIAVAGWIHAIFAVLLYGTARIFLPSKDVPMRQRVTFAAALAAGALLAAPQLLTTLTAVDISMRPSNISNSGTHVADLQGIVTAFWPAYVYPMRWFSSEWGPPVYYAAWFLLPAALIAFREKLTSIKNAAWLVGPAFALLLASLGPEQLGPSRYPMRLLPAAWCALIPVAATIMSNYRASEPSSLIRWTAALLLWAALLSWQAHPDRTLVLAFWVAVIVLASMSTLGRDGLFERTTRSVLPVLATVLVPVWIMAEYPINSSFSDFEGPERASDIEKLGLDESSSSV